MTLTPKQALEKLIQGNQRFISGEPEHPNQNAERRAHLTGGQNPFATIFGCSDSRLAAEVIFDQGLGDMFVVRTAGQVMESTTLGSLEFGVEGLSTPLIVVLGHDSCGAVKATKQSLQTGQLPGGFQRNLVERIIPAAISANLPADCSINDVVREHTRYTVESILEQSSIIAQAVQDNRTAVVGLFYHLAGGMVERVCSSDNI
ncbi:MAG: carbonic anhydrase [Rothia sp. (in: high G+C Gram-positive bacteria)]|nr:carbonic anhydrase [Rothia sp. (in: high G+C Gram-positive bacteria)]